VQRKYFGGNYFIIPALYRYFLILQNTTLEQVIAIDGDKGNTRRDIRYELMTGNYLFQVF
jgi:hypothetical protein